MNLPAQLRSELEAALSTRIHSASFVSGGDINQAARVETTDGTLFVKWNYQAPHDMFAEESHGLKALNQAASHIETLRIPQVVSVEKNWLALEWIEPVAPQNIQEFSQRFAHDLAQLHHAYSGEKFGFEHDNYIGVLPQRNSWHASWPEFYRDCRLRPQIETARERGLLHRQRDYSLAQVCDNVEKVLASLEPRPSLLHGDLWSGNFLSCESGAVLIDPAAYSGEREVELAFIELFGGFPPNFMEHYNAAFRLQEGYEQRRVLHQLYPLLVHLNHFGESYGSRVDAACAACLRTLKN